MLNPTHLKTLRQVLATGSFAEAAARMGYTASAVSQQIAALERSTGVALFERDGRSSRPTPAARALADRAAGVLASLESLEREVRALAASGGGAVSVGGVPTANAVLLPRALVHLRAHHPDVAVRLDERDPERLVPAVESGSLDAALVHEHPGSAAPPRRGLTWARLFSERLVLLLPAGGAAGPGRSMRELRTASWITAAEGSEAERCLQRLCAEAGYTPRIAHRSSDHGVIRGLVAAGLGVALVPALEALPAQDLVVVPLPPGAPERTTLVVSRPANENPALEPLLRALARTAADVRGLAGVQARGEGGRRAGGPLRQAAFSDLPTEAADPDLHAAE